MVAARYQLATLYIFTRQLTRQLPIRLPRLRWIAEWRISHTYPTMNENRRGRSDPTHSLRPIVRIYVSMNQQQRQVHHTTSHRHIVTIHPPRRRLFVLRTPQNTSNIPILRRTMWWLCRRYSILRKEQLHRTILRHRLQCRRRCAVRVEHRRTWLGVTKGERTTRTSGLSKLCPANQNLMLSRQQPPNSSQQCVPALYWNSQKNNIIT